MQKKLDVWAVAAAILVTEEELHYTELDKRIRKSGLARLGGSTPSQTVGSKIRKKEIDNESVFLPGCDKGRYILANPDTIIEHPMVKEALKFLQEGQQTAFSKDEEIKKLRDTIAVLKNKNNILEKKLLQIRSICEME